MRKLSAAADRLSPSCIKPRSARFSRSPLSPFSCWVRLGAPGPSTLPPHHARLAGKTTPSAPAAPSLLNPCPCLWPPRAPHTMHLHFCELLSGGLYKTRALPEIPCGVRNLLEISPEKLPGKTPVPGACQPAGVPASLLAACWGLGSGVPGPIYIPDIWGPPVPWSPPTQESHIRYRYISYNRTGPII